MSEERRRKAYRGLFRTDLDSELLREFRTSPHGGYAIGNKRFREQIEHALTWMIHDPRMVADTLSGTFTVFMNNAG